MKQPRMNDNDRHKDRRHDSRRDSLWAAAVTFTAAALILLWLFFCGLTFDRAALAVSSTPEIQMPEDEELFIEPEIVRNLGEDQATEHDEPAPALKGEPEPAPIENTKHVEPGKNEKPAPPVEKPITQKKESPVKATEPPKTNEDKKKVTSKMANKFPGRNGTQSGTSGGSGAGGNGVGIAGSVAGRTFKGCPKPSVELQNRVVVEVRVTIDSKGKVTSATARSKSGKPSAAILRACEQAARGAHWSEDPDTPSARGTLTFTITPR